MEVRPVRRARDAAPFPEPIELPAAPLPRLQLLLDARFTREEDKRQVAMLYAVNAPLSGAEEPTR